MQGRPNQEHGLRRVTEGDALRMYLADAVLAGDEREVPC